MAGRRRWIAIAGVALVSVAVAVLHAQTRSRTLTCIGPHGALQCGGATPVCCVQYHPPAASCVAAPDACRDGNHWPSSCAATSDCAPGEDCCWLGDHIACSQRCEHPVCPHDGCSATDCCAWGPSGNKFCFHGGC
jgi:hypothetical protein